MNQRIELNLHTKMGNGIIEPKCIVEEMSKRGYQTFALTDENSVQAFPAIDKSVQVYNETHEDKMKVIYGAELNVIDTYKRVSLKDTFIVLDIETTGLAEDDEIIMVAAQKWEKGNIIDELRKLIKPKKRLQESVEVITKITNEMLESEKTMDMVTYELQEFLGDFPLVVLHASYVREFLNKAFLEAGLETLKNPIYDIAKLTKSEYPNLKQYHLQALAKYFPIVVPKEMKLEDRVVAIGQIFENLMLAPKENTPFKITVLVRNPQGLKHLYELITLSHTRYQKGLPLEIVVDKSAGLLIGSNAKDGELARHLDDMNEYEFIKRLLFYDYIEVLPPNYQKNIFANEAKKQIKRLMDIAFQYRKMVIATSHAHSFEKADDICFETLNKKETFFPFLNQEELKKEFSFLPEKTVQDIVVDNPNKINTLCEEIKILEEKMQLPEISNGDMKLVRAVYKKSHVLYGKDLPKEVSTRITLELYGTPILKQEDLEAIVMLGRKIILKKFPECKGKGILGSFHEAMFWIPKMLIEEASGIFYESRGALGSSFVAFLLGITEVNPLMPHYYCSNCKHAEFQKSAQSGFDLEKKACPKCGLLMKKEGHNIPYASLLGKEASLLPDININFEDTRVEEIRNKAVQIFGEEQVFYPGVIGVLSEHNAYLKVEQFCYQMGKDLEEEEKIKMAKKIAHTKVRMGIHPGGIFIVPENHTINEFTPIQKLGEKKITHFDYHELKEVLPKFNILGHESLTLLHEINNLSNQNLMDISFDDKRVFEMLHNIESLKNGQECQGLEFGIPEFSTWKGMQELKKLQIYPKNFSECVKLLGLAHGTGVFEENGLELLKEGIPLSNLITHREDIMNTLLEHSVSYEEAYDIMEFIGKGKQHKDLENWEKVKKKLREIGIEEWYINSCEKIIYLFPKAHHVSYMLRYYRLLCAKRYEPESFYNAYFKCHSDFIETHWNKTEEELKQELINQNSDLKKEEIMLLLEARVRNIKIIEKENETCYSK